MVVDASLFRCRFKMRDDLFDVFRWRQFLWNLIVRVENAGVLQPCNGLNRPILRDTARIQHCPGDPRSMSTWHDFVLNIFWFFAGQETTRCGAVHRRFKPDVTFLDSTINDAYGWSSPIWSSNARDFLFLSDSVRWLRLLHIIRKTNFKNVLQVLDNVRPSPARNPSTNLERIRKSNC